MIYGQDAPVALPVADLYDSTMMQMYLGAVRDQYNTAQQEQKEFLKQYGDFYSPFARDNEYWYNNTMGPVQQLMQEAGSRGIDLTRSPEGRALIASTMRNIPYAKLAQIKRNAAAGEEYLKNRAALQRAGKYNPLYEQYILDQQGIPSFENWDTATMGAWTRTSPEEYKDLHDSTYQWVDNKKKSFLGTTPDKRYQIWGVTDDDLRKSLTPHLSGFVGNNLGGYHLANARREVLEENPTLQGADLERAAMDRLRDNIVQANREYTYQEIQADPYTQQDRQFAQQMKMEQMKEAAADRRQRAQFAHDNAKNTQPQLIQVPLSFSEQTDTGSMRKRAATAGTDENGVAMDIRTIDSNIRKIIDFNERMHKSRKGDVYHGKVANFWKNLYTNNQLDVDKLIKRKVLKADGTLDSAYFRAYNKAIAPSILNSKTDEQLVNNAAKYYNTMTFEIPTGTTLNQTAKGLLFGNEKGKYNGTGNVYRQLQLDNQYYYTPVRMVNVSPTQTKTGVKMKKNNLYNQFNKFLRDSKLTVWEAPGDNSVKTATVDRPGGVVERDFSGYVSVPKDALLPFLKDHVKKDAKTSDYAEIYRKLGLKTYNSQSQVIDSSTQNKSGRKWKDVEFIQIPITKVINNNRSTELSEYDTTYDKSVYGSGTAYKLAVDRQNKSLNR